MNLFEGKYSVYKDENHSSWAEPEALSYGLKKKYKPAATIGFHNNARYMILFEPRPEDKKHIKGIRLKTDEEIYRFANQSTVDTDLFPFIKVNLKKGHAYFLTPKSESGEIDKVEFKDKAVRLKFARILDDSDSSLDIKYPNMKEELDKDQLAKREEIVKAMKDKKAEFQKRYGDKWKSVMYATATKQVKEAVESSKEPVPSPYANVTGIFKSKDYMPTGVMIEKGGISGKKTVVKAIHFDQDDVMSLRMREKGSEKKAFSSIMKEINRELKGFESISVDRKYFITRQAAIKKVESLITNYIEAIMKGYADQPIREGMITESVISNLQAIVKKNKPQEIEFVNGDSLRVDAKTANALISVYNGVNGNNQKKMKEALEKSEESFMKIVDFAFSKQKG